MFDTNGSGELDIDEFSLMLNTMQINMNDERVYMLFHALDEGLGTISLHALIESLLPKGTMLEQLHGVTSMSSTLHKQKTEDIHPWLKACGSSNESLGSPVHG